MEVIVKEVLDKYLIRLKSGKQGDHKELKVTSKKWIAMIWHESRMVHARTAPFMLQYAIRQIKCVWLFVQVVIGDLIGPPHAYIEKKKLENHLVCKEY